MTGGKSTALVLCKNILKYKANVRLKQSECIKSSGYLFIIKFFLCVFLLSCSGRKNQTENFVKNASPLQDLHLMCVICMVEASYFR